MNLSILFKSFEYDNPRSQTCCFIGNYFLRNNKFEQAIYWYNLALTIRPNLQSGGFFEPDYHNFIPYIQLCVCYFKIGNIQKINRI